MSGATAVTKAVNPLANPKGVKYLCELCQKPAFVQCNLCKVTYYCSHEHQRVDWVSIHERICPKVRDLKGSSQPFLGSDEERQRRKQEQADQQLEIIQITRKTGQKLLFEQSFEEAIPAALQSLKHCIEVYGTASIELVISYLILAEASIGLNQLSQAEQYLSQAEWTVLKTDNVTNDFKAKLYRNLGLLYDARNQHDEALRNFANGIYYASEEYGTDDIRTSSGYYYMANVFLKLGKPDITSSLFKQTTEIWLEKLRVLCEDRLFKKPTTSAASSKNRIGPKQASSLVDSRNQLDEAEAAEVRQVLYSIYTYRTGTGNPVRDNEEALVGVQLALGYLEFYSANMTESAKFFNDARDALSRKDAAAAAMSQKTEELISEIDQVMDVVRVSGGVAA